MDKDMGQTKQNKINNLFILNCIKRAKFVNK